jgi:hypothetical protein
MCNMLVQLTVDGDVEVDLAMGHQNGPDSKYYDLLTTLYWRKT